MERVQEMALILLENYTLGELEERFDLTTEDIKDGLEGCVEKNYKSIKRGLKEDLFELDGY